jgi:hypothetical protein
MLGYRFHVRRAHCSTYYRKGVTVNSYNGFSGKEREAKLRAQHNRERMGLASHPPGPCAICGDPDAKLEAHDKNYSQPYAWEPPAQYALCHKCHSRLHTRFHNPGLWEAHKAHVRRGGYSSDLARPEVNTEFESARRRNDLSGLKPLRARRLTGEEWWQSLSTNPS